MKILNVLTLLLKCGLGIKTDPCIRHLSQGLAVIFSHHLFIKTKKGGHLLGGPKVKVEFRHLFSLQKRFSLYSSRKINANIDVFC